MNEALEKNKLAAVRFMEKHCYHMSSRMKSDFEDILCGKKRVMITEVSEFIIHDDECISHTDESGEIYEV